MDGLKLYILFIGDITMPSKAHMTPGKDEGIPVNFPAYCYLIDHPTGKVLVDCGMHNGGPAHVREEDIVTNRLAEIGVQPDDIKYVVLTHLHIDHAAYMTSFPNATFVVRKEELRSAWWPETCERGYVYAAYKDARYFRYIQPKDDEVYDLFYDGSVLLIDTKCHTRGHQSVVLDLKELGKTVLVGDAAAFRENMEEKILPGYCSDSWAGMQTLERLKVMEEEGYFLIFGHDIPQWKELKLSPEFYE